MKLLQPFAPSLIHDVIGPGPAPRGATEAAADHLNTLRRGGSDEAHLDTEDKALVLAITVTALVALVGLIGYQYAPLTMPIGETMEAYQRGDRWRLMLMPPSDQAVPLGRYADDEGCQEARQAYVRQTIEGGRPVPRLACGWTQVWWIRAIAWPGVQKREAMPREERRRVCHQGPKACGCFHHQAGSMTASVPIRVWGLSMIRTENWDRA